MAEDKTLALIHTSMVFLRVETLMFDLFRKIMPEVRLINLLDDSLLPDTMTAGRVTPTCVERMALLAKTGEKTGANAILSLCSSLGPAVDEARKHVTISIIKIDDAMTQAAVEQAYRIGVMATVHTTLAPTVDLLKEKALALRKEVCILPGLVQGAFDLLMKGKKAEHDDMISKNAAVLRTQTDLIVFAQASMTRLAPRISKEIGQTVLTSPEMGIEYTKKILESL